MSSNQKKQQQEIQKNLAILEFLLINFAQTKERLVDFDSYGCSLISDNVLEISKTIKHWDRLMKIDF